MNKIYLLMKKESLIKNVILILFTKLNLKYMNYVLMAFSSMLIFNKNSLFLGYSVFLDGMSFSFIWLSFWILILSSFILQNSKNTFWVNILKLKLMVFFSVKKLLYFFILFEFCLFPMIMLMMKEGKNPERLYALQSFFIYTLFGALPFILILLTVFKSLNMKYEFTKNMSTISYFYKSIYLFTNLIMMKKVWVKYIALSLVLLFLMKLPIWGLHTWLPKVHVEASVAGSMILAGMLLKLGKYGMMRVSHLVISYINMSMFTYMFMWVIMGSFYASLVCMKSQDLKVFMAYSSVVHTGIPGIMPLLPWDNAIITSIIMAKAHGFCSSGLFFMINVMYSRSSSRNMIIKKKIPSSLYFYLFLLCAFNCSVPPAFKLLGEIFISNILFTYSKFICIFFFFLMMMVSGSYCMYLYLNLINSKKNYYLFNIYYKEYLILMMHLVPLMFGVLIVEYILL